MPSTALGAPLRCRSSVIAPTTDLFALTDLRLLASARTRRCLILPRALLFASPVLPFIARRALPFTPPLPFAAGRALSFMPPALPFAAGRSLTFTPPRAPLLMGARVVLLTAARAPLRLPLPLRAAGCAALHAGFRLAAARSALRRFSLPRPLLFMPPVDRLFVARLVL